MMPKTLTIVNHHKRVIDAGGAKRLLFDSFWSLRAHGWMPARMFWRGASEIYKGISDLDSGKMKGERMDISRRNFLKCSLAAGALAGGSMALVGCSPSAQDSGESASDDGLAGEKACGGNWSWSVKPDPVPDDQIAEEIDCDICIVGLGAAGVPATLYSALAGAKTVALQKQSVVALNGANVGVWGTEHEKEVGIACDIQADIKQYALAAQEGRVNLKLVSNVLSRSGEVMDYLTSVVSEPPLVCGVSGNHVRCQWYLDPDTAVVAQGSDDAFEGINAFFANMAKKAEELGAQLLYGTPAIQLETADDGSVIGVVGQKKDGSYIRVRASKGIVLCTGDFSNDDEMKAAYAPGTLGVFVKCAHGNTGDGAKMGLWAGGALDDGASNTQMSVLVHQGGSSRNPPFGSIPWLLVNKNGLRYVNEEAGGTVLANFGARQPDSVGYSLMDAHIFDNLDKFGEDVETAPDRLQKAIDEGKAFKADTLQELAELCEIDYEALEATVERYNEFAATGIDVDFGVSSENLVLNAIRDAPFYAIRRDISLLGVSMGLKCDEYGQVVNSEGKPLGGLYAAGGPQGSFFETIYPIGPFGGFSLGRAFAGGVLSVKHALGTYDEPVAL